MNEYASRFAYLAPIETMDENETLLRLYISSIISLLIIGLYKFFNTKTPRLSRFTTNFIFGCFFILSMCISARLSQVVQSEMKSVDLHLVVLLYYTNCTVTVTFYKFVAALEITSCFPKIDFCARKNFLFARNIKLMTFFIVPSYSLIFCYFKDEIEIMNYIDPFTIMKIIRVACLLLTTIAQIRLTTCKCYFDKLAFCAVVNFMSNVVEGLSALLILESK